MSRRDDAMIALYDFVSKRKPWITIPASLLLVWLATGPIVYGFIKVVHWLLNAVFDLPADTDYSALLVLSGVFWVVAILSLERVLAWAYDGLQHLLYRPYINAMMRKYHNHEI